MLIPEPLKMRIKKGDNVEVIAGKSKGHRGRVKKVIPITGKVIVEGANYMSKITRPTMKNPRRDIIKLEAPLNRSNVMIVCPSCKQPTRIGAQILPNGKKARKCCKCGELMDKV